MSGISPAEMAKSDVVVIWGTNAAATQVNLMTHATRARKEHGAKIVAIDIYPTETMRQADLALQLRPGTDGALACAVMHVLFRDGYADRDYMARLHRRARGARRTSSRPHARMGERHHRARRSRRSRLSRRWSAATSGRSSASATASRASATARPTCTRRSASPRSPGAWAHEGGGALHASSAVYGLDKTLIEGLDVRDESVQQARHVARRRDPDRRPRGAEGRRAGPRDVDPEHQPDGRRARPGDRCGAVFGARTCSSACTSSS